MYKMAKDSSSSRQLLGTIKFIFDKTKSRTLNATQAYDTSTSQIVLASYKGKSTINTPTNSLGDSGPDPSKVFGVAVEVTGTQNPALLLSPQPGKDVLIGSAGPKTITAGWTVARSLPAGAAKQTLIVPTTGQFSGILIKPAGITPVDPGGTKSNATKEIFAGNITVGTGLYRTWQGKYAVLKVDLLTDKAILRVYNE
jgi:hypothetical protein